MNSIRKSGTSARVGLHCLTPGRGEFRDAAISRPSNPVKGFDTSSLLQSFIDTPASPLAVIDPITSEKMTHGFGFTGMEVRLRSIGGELRVSSIPGSGTVLEAVAPRGYEQARYFLVEIGWVPTPSNSRS